MTEGRQRFERARLKDYPRTLSVHFTAAPAKPSANMFCIYSYRMLKNIQFLCTVYIEACGAFTSLSLFDDWTIIFLVALLCRVVKGLRIICKHLGRSDSREL